MPVYAPLIDVDCGVLFWSPLLTQNEACLGVLEVSQAELLDGDRLVVELPFLRRVFTLCHAAKENAGFLARSFRCPDPMEPERETTGPTLRAILHHIAASAGSEHAKPEPGQIIIPDEVVVGFGFNLVDKTFADSWHGFAPSKWVCRGPFCGSTTEAPGRKFQRTKGYVRRGRRPR